VLGYQPADANFDGKFRPIEVRVKRPACGCVRGAVPCARTVENAIAATDQN
jgi:hypothetical protein